jgi:hypothetical protein
MLFKRNREMIRFSGRRHTKLGIISTCIGAAVVLGFLSISLVSGLNRGNGGIILGIMGLALFSLAVYGFVLGYKSFKKKDIFYRYPILGVALNGFMTILLLILYILGFGG